MTTVAPQAGRVSHAAQDYLKALYALQHQTGKAVATSQLADRLGVSAPSASAMLKRLVATGLVIHAPYRGSELTESGVRVALDVIRHHRLLETYLAAALGMSKDRVHAEAEVLEHAISPELADLIAEKLGHPTHDPHGEPIPFADAKGGASLRAGRARPVL